MWSIAGVLVLLIAAVVGVRAARRDPSPDKPDLGSISGSWLTEHRAAHDGKP